MVTTTVNDYWISSSAVSVSLNAMGNSNYAQVGIAPNASIVAFVKGIIDYDNSHKCRTWKLTGAPTAFGDSLEKYVYVAIPRSETAENQNAIVVFPSELIDIEGKNAAGAQKGSTDYYYIYLQGIISPSIVDGVETARKFTQNIQSGMLMSDYALMNNTDSEWYSYSAVTGRVSFLKEIIMESTSKFLNLLADSITATTVSLSNLVFGGKTITGIADENTDKDSDAKLLTPHSGKGFFLSKKEDDTAEGNLQFKGTLDVFGNFVAKADATVSKSLTVGEDATIGGNVAIEGKAEVKGDLLVEEGKTGSKIFNQGTLGNGWRIGIDGSAEMDSLVLRKFLEVPELRFNRITIRTGVQWQTFGGGLIEEVHELDATHGIIKLKLEDGEAGAIKKDDKCMGIFHNETDASANSDHDEDDRHGNFAFKGFMTIYFIVTDLCDEDGNVVSEDDAGRRQYFKYELRCASDATWADAHHPQQSMSFAAYANANDSSRQACIYSTTTYLNMLTGMVGWTHDGNNIALIYGELNGFTIKTKKGSVIELEGHGIAFGNAYMWGNIKQFERESYLISQQAYYMITADAPEVVLTDPDYTEHYNWTTEAQITSTECPYAYVYWKQSFDDGSIKNEGLSMYSFDNSVLSIKLSKQIVSVALSNWYDDENPTDVVSFDVTAQALMAYAPQTLTEAIADSAIEGFSYTAEYAEDMKSVTFHISINGYVPKDVDGMLAEDNFVAVQLSCGEGHTVVSNITIIDNRQGEDGDDGKSAPRTLFIRNTSRPSVPTVENPDGWSPVPTSGEFDLNVKLEAEGTPSCLTNYGFDKQDTDDGVVFTSLCKYKDNGCSWMSATLRGKAGDRVKIPYKISSEDNTDIGFITTEAPIDGNAPGSYLVRISGEESGELSYTLQTSEDVLYFGYIKDRTEYDGEDTFTVNFGRLYSITEILDENGDFEGWAGPVIVEGKDGLNGTDGKDGADSCTLQLSVNTIVFPTKFDESAGELQISDGAIARKIKATIYVGTSPQSTFIASAALDLSTSIAVSHTLSEVTAQPSAGGAWIHDRTLTITAYCIYNGERIEMEGSVNVVGSEQGQTAVGPQGTSVSRIEEQYQATEKENDPLIDTAWSNTIINPTVSKPFVWNREVVYFYDPASGTETSQPTDAHISATFSDGLLNVRSWYAVSSTKAVPADSAFGIYKTDVQAAINAMDDTTNRYLWNWELTEYKDASKNTNIKRLVAIWGEKGRNGADAVQQNIFGYDRAFYSAHNAILGMAMHTSTGFVVYAKKTSTNNYFYINIDVAGKIKAGRRYAIHGSVKSPVTGSLSFGFRKANGTIDASSQQSIRTSETFVDFCSALVVKEDEAYVFFQVTAILAFGETFEGLVEVINLKIEDVTDFNSDHTVYSGLSLAVPTRKENVLLDTLSYSNKWVLDNAVVRGYYQAHKVVECSVSAINYIQAIAQTIELSSNTTYTLSWFEKASSSNVTIHPRVFTIDSSDGTWICVYNDGVNTPDVSRGNPHPYESHLVGTTWVRRFLTFRSVSGGQAKIAFNAKGSGTLYLSMIKLEEGDQMTDWTENVADRIGKDGIQGCVVRPCGKYNPTASYFNDSELEAPRPGETARYIDVVMYESGGITNSYERKPNNNGAAGHAPTETAYWQEANKFSFVATDILMADAAWIQYLTGKSVYVTDKDNAVVAGIQSVDSNDKPMLFAGQAKDNAHDADFRVYRDGRLVAKNAEIKGIIQAESGYFNGDITARSVNSHLLAIPHRVFTYTDDPITADRWVNTSLIYLSKLLNNSGNLDVEPRPYAIESDDPDIDYLVPLESLGCYQIRCVDGKSVILPTSGVPVGMHVIIYCDLVETTHGLEYVSVTIDKAWVPEHQLPPKDEYFVGLYRNGGEAEVASYGDKNYLIEDRPPIYEVWIAGGYIELMACPAGKNKVAWNLVNLRGEAYKLFTWEELSEIMRK